MFIYIVIYCRLVQLRNRIKNLVKFLLPKTLRHFLWAMYPRIELLNTYCIRVYNEISGLSSIDKKFIIREIGWSDSIAIKTAYDFRGKNAFYRKVPSRLNAQQWVGLAVIDISNNEIAYIAWVVKTSIDYFEEFGISLKPGQFLLKDGYCVPHYRHQGLHTRMEQERINFCIRNGATEIFIQIHNSNKKGVHSVQSNGYMLYQQDYLIHWPIFNVYRPLKAFLKSPFRKIVK